MAAHDQRRAAAAEAAAAEAAAAKAAQAARAAAATVAPLEATFQEIKRELFPERSENGKASQVGKSQERKGCCDGVVIFDVWASFNMFQSPVQG